MPYADILFRCEVACEGGGQLLPPALHVWLAAPSGNDQAGAIPLRVNLTICHEVDCLGADDGQILQMSRLPLCITRRQLPFGGVVTTGMINHLTYWDLAAWILENGRATHETLRVTLVKVSHSPFGGDRFHVHGEEFGEEFVLAVGAGDMGGASDPNEADVGAGSFTASGPDGESKTVRETSGPGPIWCIWARGGHDSCGIIQSHAHGCGGASRP
jgi:hypothetical protein